MNDSFKLEEEVKCELTPVNTSLKEALQRIVNSPLKKLLEETDPTERPET